MAHVCHRGSSSPLVATHVHAGRPACFADGPTVDRGAPKGIRNLTCGIRKSANGLTEYHIVAGHAACAVPVSSVASQPNSSSFRPSSARKAREWHASATRHFRTLPRSARTRPSRSKVSARRGNYNSQLQSRPRWRRAKQSGQVAHGVRVIVANHRTYRRPRNAPCLQRLRLIASTRALRACDRRQRPPAEE